jgi:pyrimidine-nucleoside phosphorylase
MFYLGERTKSVDEGRALATKLIASGEAVAKFKQGITLQSGDARVIDDYGILPQAKNRVEIKGSANGFLAATNCMEFGICLAMLGGGREKKEDKIDPGVGLEFHKRIGDRVAAGETLVTIYYNNDAKFVEAQQRITQAFIFSDQPVLPKKLIRRLVGQGPLQ